jgi:4-hydroxy-3-methylbut-2-en-1-yl diphosphate synthase IspG/GcpE
MVAHLPHVHKPHVHTQEEFLRERQDIEEVFTPLVLKAKQLKRAMRIGTNHGRLCWLIE